MIKGLGQWAFLGGVILAIIFGAFQPYDWVLPTLVVLGFIVGLLNITAKETGRFLLATVALLLAEIVSLGAGIDRLPIIGLYLKQMLPNIAVFVAPAALIVALKEVYELTVEK